MGTGGHDVTDVAGGLAPGRAGAPLKNLKERAPLRGESRRESWWVYLVDHRQHPGITPLGAPPLGAPPLGEPPLVIECLPLLLFLVGREPSFIKLADQY